MHYIELDYTNEENVNELNNYLLNSSDNEIINLLVKFIDADILTIYLINKINIKELNIYAKVCLYKDKEMKLKIINYLHSLDISLASLDNRELLTLFNNELIELEKKAIEEGKLCFGEDFVYQTDEVSGIFYSIVNKYTKKIPSDLDPIFSDYMLYLRIPELRKKFEIIFKKCHFDIAFPVELLSDINIEALNKFNYKKFNKIIEYIDPYTKGLFEFIEFFDLFTDDRALDKMLNNLENLLYTFKEYTNINENDLVEIDTILYERRKNYIMPENLIPLIDNRMSFEYYKSLKKEKGTLGREINDFLNPYVLLNGKYVLKRNVTPKFGLERELEISEYEEILNGDDLDKLAFINPFREININKKYLKYNRELYTDVIEKRKEEYSFIIIQIITKGKIPKNYKDFLNDNLLSFIKDNNLFYLFYEYIKTHDKINSLLDLKKMQYNVKYPSSFGFNHFSEMCKRALVPKSSYKEYEELYKKTLDTVSGTVPNFCNSYEVNGYEYIIAVLSKNHPLNLLIGEPGYSNCCQKMYGLGEGSMLHAVLSPFGSILFIGQKIDDNIKLIAQGWTWVNNNLLCIDNIEASNELKQNSTNYDKELIYGLINCFAKDVIEYSNEEINKFVIDSIEYAKGDIDKLYQLKDMLEYKKIDTVIIGNMNSYIEELVCDRHEKIDFKVIPEDYNEDGYTDTYNRKTNELEAYYLVKNKFKKSEKLLGYLIYLSSTNLGVKVKEEITDFDMYYIAKSLYNIEIESKEQFEELLGYSTDEIIYFRNYIGFALLDSSLKLINFYNYRDDEYAIDAQEELVNELKEKILYKQKKM